MEENRSFEVILLQQGKVAVIIEFACAGCQVAGIAVVVQILGMGEGNILSEQGKGFANKNNIYNGSISSQDGAETVRIETFVTRRARVSFR